MESLTLSHKVLAGLLSIKSLSTSPLVSMAKFGVLLQAASFSEEMVSLRTICSELDSYPCLDKLE
jgi:hypothetical protein